MLYFASRLGFERVPWDRLPACRFQKLTGSGYDRQPRIGKIIGSSATLPVVRFMSYPGIGS